VPLQWSGVPARARELVLTVEDPDAPGGTFLHWAVFGISPRLHALDGAPPGAPQGRNSFGHNAYGGPCPPPGKGAHSYVFTLYALSSPSGLGAGADRDAVRRALDRAAFAEGRLTGRYARK
jgi:Raf kinase inhibitor-like YbhB/YbcL family protein